MTPRQAKFVEHYLITRNAADAARRAGYSDNGAKVTGCRLLTNPNLKAAIAAKEADLAAKHDLSRERVLQDLIDGVELARSHNDPMAMITASREIARLCGFYPPVQIKQKEPAGLRAFQERLAVMSECDLRALLIEDHLGT